jgi:triacylglycerol lipase
MADEKSDRASRTVLLIHGLGRTSLSMSGLGRFFQAADYRVLNFGYPSTRLSIREISEMLGLFLEEHLPPGSFSTEDKASTEFESSTEGKPSTECMPSTEGKFSTIDVVTHSLGGIVARHYFRKRRRVEARRVVMLSPPNRGSALADFIARSSIARKLLGPVIVELGTGVDSVPKKLPEPRFTCGVIAGTIPLDFYFMPIVSLPSDGKVAISETRLATMKDFIAIRCSHTFMMNNGEVQRQALHFIEHGTFKKSG